MNRRKFGKLGNVSTMAAVAPCEMQAAVRELTPNAERENLKQPFSPTILSIRRHNAPEWCDDVKFRMFIDYELHSIAGSAPKQEQGAMYPDSYRHNMYSDPATVEYHKKTWGANSQGDNFIRDSLQRIFIPKPVRRSGCRVQIGNRGPRRSQGFGRGAERVRIFEPAYGLVVAAVLYDSANPRTL